MFWHGLAWHQKMPKKSSFQQLQTWYERYVQVFENAKFLGDLTIYIKTGNQELMQKLSFGLFIWEKLLNLNCVKNQSYLACFSRMIMCCCFVVRIIRIIAINRLV